MNLDAAKEVGESSKQAIQVFAAAGPDHDPIWIHGLAVTSVALASTDGTEETVLREEPHACMIIWSTQIRNRVVMKTINRSENVLLPRQPMLNWLTCLNPDGTPLALEQMGGDSPVLLFNPAVETSVPVEPSRTVIHDGRLSKYSI